jgi:transcriptional regulator with XRE-family HTH domain
VENTNHSIGSVIKEIRREKQLTQNNITEGFFSTRHLINIENGSVSPSTEILLHICQKLGISMEELFHRVYAKDQAALDEIKVTFTSLYENGAFDQINEALTEKLAQISHKYIRGTITYKFLSIMTAYYGENNEQTLFHLEQLLENNPIILEQPFKDLHTNILIQYIQVSSYSKKSLVLAQSIDFIKDGALTYVINTGLLIDQEWGKVITNCRLSIKEVQNKSLFILPGLYLQLGISLHKMNDAKGLLYMKKAFVLAQLNGQAYYLKGFTEMLAYFEVHLPKDLLEESQDLFSGQ